MGEAKRKQSKREFLETVGTALGRELADRGRLVEAGFAIFAHAVISPTAPEVQREEMRLAFMAGAEHVFSSLVNMLEGESEIPTENDMRRMELIAKSSTTGAAAFPSACSHRRAGHERHDRYQDARAAGRHA